MKVSNSKERLKEMMSVLNLKPVDICRKCGIQKSSLSNYLNGDREPRQDQISLICDPFNIDPSWLMGYDVPMYMSKAPKPEPSDDKIAKAIELYSRYENLPPEMQKEFQDYLAFLQSKSARNQ